MKLLAILLILFAVYILYLMHTAPVIDEPYDDELFLNGGDEI